MLWHDGGLPTALGGCEEEPARPTLLESSPWDLSLPDPRPVSESHKMLSSHLVNLEETFGSSRTALRGVGFCLWGVLRQPLALVCSRKLASPDPWILPYTGPACPTPLYVSRSCKVRSLELLWKFTPSCIFSKDVKINFLKRIQGKASVVFCVSFTSLGLPGHSPGIPSLYFG